MMLTNIFDFMVDHEDNFIRHSIHIPDHPFYEEIGMPYTIDSETGIIYTNSGEFAILTVSLIDSYDWEIVDE